MAIDLGIPNFHTDPNPLFIGYIIDPYFWCLNMLKSLKSLLLAGCTPLNSLFIDCSVVKSSLLLRELDDWTSCRTHPHPIWIHHFQWQNSAQKMTHGNQIPFRGLFWGAQLLLRSRCARWRVCRVEDVGGVGAKDLQKFPHEVLGCFNFWIWKNGLR